MEQHMNDTVLVDVVDNDDNDDDDNNNNHNIIEKDDDNKDDMSNSKEYDSTVWGRGPPIPPHPDVVMNDISCQGTMAMALHEALVEFQQLLQQQQQQHSVLQEKYHFQLDINEVMRVFGESIVHQQHIQYDAQYDQAMEQQQQQSQSQQQRRNHINSNSNNNNSNNNNNNKIAPAAMLHGRINHYNRYGTKWRIVVDDVEIVPRRMIDIQQLRQMKRHNNNMSLWSIMLQPQPQPQQNNTTTTTSTTDELPIRIPRLEILLYDDIE